ncbi:MAG: hypothetical protein Q4D30_12320 [Bacteroidales bacterium]|nr:hypothetical protein [Bacteroidales bacterium]
MLEISLLQIYDENRKNGAFLVKSTVQWMQKQNFLTKQWQRGIGAIPVIEERVSPFLVEKEPSAEPYKASGGLLFQKMEVLKIKEFCSE